MKKYLVEFIGTFFLVFTVGMAVRSRCSPRPDRHRRLADDHGRYCRRTCLRRTFQSGRLARRYSSAASCEKPGISSPTGSPSSSPAWRPRCLVTFLFVPAIAADARAASATVPSAIVEFLFTFALGWVVLNVVRRTKAPRRQFLLRRRHRRNDRRDRARSPVGGVSSVQPGGRARRVHDGPGVSQSSSALYVVADLRRGAVAALTYKLVHGAD